MRVPGPVRNCRSSSALSPSKGPGLRQSNGRRSCVRLFDVLPGVVEQPDDVMVVEGVEREPAGAADAHEPRGAEQTQLVRDGGLGEAHERREIADAALAVGQRVDQPHARRIAQQLEHVGDRFDGAAGKQALLELRDGRGIGRMALLTRLNAAFARSAGYGAAGTVWSDWVGRAWAP